MAEFIKQSWLFPVIQSIHIIGLTILVGTITLVDLRLLGISMRRHEIPNLAAALASWTSVGLLTVIVTGPLLFGADIGRYLKNPAFILKMALLAAALAGHFTLHRSAIRQNAASVRSRQKAIAVLSLILWSAVV